MRRGLLAQPPICRNAPGAAQRRGGSGALAGWKTASTRRTPVRARTFAMATAAGPDSTWGPKRMVAMPALKEADEPGPSSDSDWSALRIRPRMMASSNKAGRWATPAGPRVMRSVPGAGLATTNEVESFAATSPMVETPTGFGRPGEGGRGAWEIGVEADGRAATILAGGAEVEGMAVVCAAVWTAAIRAGFLPAQAENRSRTQRDATTGTLPFDRNPGVAPGAMRMGAR